MIEGIDEFHARLYVEDDQGQVEAFRDGMGKHRLARSRFALEKKRHLENDGDVHDLGKFLIEYVP